MKENHKLKMSEHQNLDVEQHLEGPAGPGFFGKSPASVASDPLLTLSDHYSD